MSDVKLHGDDHDLDRFIPISKNDCLTALCEQGAFASRQEREKFRHLCEGLAAIFHYDYSKPLDRLRDAYHYLSPDIAAVARTDFRSVEHCYAEFVQLLDGVLKKANFIELSHDDIHDAHRHRPARVHVRVPLDDFREVRFYRRGRHVEETMADGWFGLHRRKVECEVYDDVVLIVAMKSQAEIGSRRELKALERRKIVPGSVMLKYFRNIAASDLYALFPNVRVVMSNRDKLVLGVPALAGGIPILFNLYATITVLFLVIAFYLGRHVAVQDRDLKTALTALGGIAALGGFVVQQWMKYQRQSLKYQMELTDNIYYRNINNNAGIFNYIIGAAEEQECKEAFLAYHFLHAAAAPPTQQELESRIETWLRQTFGVTLDFDVAEALAKLERFGLLRRDGERLLVSSLDGAIAQLHEVWTRFFSAEETIAAE